MSSALAFSSATAASFIISHHPPSLDNLSTSGTTVHMMLQSSLSLPLSLSATRHRSKCNSPIASNRRPSKKMMLRCDVAVKSTASVDTHPSSSSETELGAEEKAKVGAKVRVNVPLKVYHVVRVLEMELTGMVGVIKDYVAVWKGKRISANLPYKVEFVKEIEGRGPVKFFAHLKEEEFEYVD